MYLGSIVEIFNSDNLRETPVHPYTRALISSIPSSLPGEKSKRIILEGEIPSPLNAPDGCLFLSRCRYKTPRCEQERPELEIIGDGHQVACHHWKNTASNS